MPTYLPGRQAAEWLGVCQNSLRKHADDRLNLKDFEHAVLLVCRVFTNKEGSTGRLSLVCSDLTCDGERVADVKLEAY